MATVLQGPRPPFVEAFMAVLCLLEHQRVAALTDRRKAIERAEAAFRRVPASDQSAREAAFAELRRTFAEAGRPEPRRWVYGMAPWPRNLAPAGGEV